ncbi:MAG TPA: hypothetical protein VIB82_02215 [Caulobacteraceae bacterium]
MTGTAGADWIETLSDGLGSGNPWYYYPLVLGVILAAWAVGHAIGRRRRQPAATDWVADHIGVVQSALIGLLSLMIAFTFSLSLNRFEARRAAVLSEATAISETSQRAALLPPPRAAQAARLLAAYVQARIEFGNEGGRTARGRVLVDRSVALQNVLWTQAMATGAADRVRPPTSLFIDSLVALGDRHEERLAADHNQVPLAVFLTLYGLAILGTGYSGYAAGVKGARGAMSNALLAVAIATVITLIADLDTPGSGLVNISQQPLLDLQKSPLLR